MRVRHFKITLILTILIHQFSLAQRLETIREPRVTCYASDETHKRYVPPPASLYLKSGNETNTVINVEYSLMPTKAIEAFEYAVKIWEGLIDTDIPVHVQANWRTQEARVLGSAGPTNYFRNFDNAPRENLYYSVALAERLTKSELNGPGIADIVSTFNRQIDWYFGTDGNTPDSLYDFVTVVLHEIAHGLGFTGFYEVSGSTGTSFHNGETGAIAAFDFMVTNANGQSLADPDLFPKPSVILKHQLTSNQLYSSSILAKKSLSNRSPHLHAPASFDSGSSVYHLNLSSHPGELMNHAIGKGEAIHDPGAIVTGMLEDMGWKHTSINLKQPKDKESVQNVHFEMTIDSEYGIKDNTVYLHYNYNGSIDLKDSILFQFDQVSQNYKTVLEPNPETQTIEYYISVQDTMDRFFYLPSTAPTKKYEVNFGPDNEKPDINHEPLPYFLTNTDQIHLEARVDDNLGIEKVSVEYAINGLAQGEFDMLSTENNLFRGSFPVSSDQLNDQDSISYKIVATDASLNRNITALPVDGMYSFPIEKISEPVQQYFNDFSHESYDFLLNEFRIGPESGFDNNALHSPHPYPSPNQNYTYWDFYTLLKKPVILSSFSKISFDEVVLVEPGEVLTNFGDDEFWDYVIVEGSKDLGTTWLALEDGYDSRENNIWESNYKATIEGNDSKAAGEQAWYVNREIDVTANPNFSEGDTILIRFRLHSDPYANGWGWVIDNLRIQQPVSLPDMNTSKTDIRIFPNPVSSLLVVQVRSPKDLKKYTLELFTPLGQSVQVAEFNRNAYDDWFEMDMNSLKNGLYYLRIRDQYKTIQTFKVMKLK